MNKIHLLFRERKTISVGLDAGKSIRKIANELGRNHTVISREINRNKRPDGKYDPFLAQEIAEERELLSNSKRAKKNERIMKFVREKLNEDWSPEQIAGYIKEHNTFSGETICHETIYRYIYHKDNRRLKLWVNLRRSKPRRMENHGRKPQKETIPNRTFIDKRPETINLREQIGHWESDNMLGKRESCGVSATVERKSRFLTLWKLESLTAEAKKESLICPLGKLPPWMRRSITFDNGSENARHEDIAAEINVSTYFCYPYHPYEKGTVENLIGLVRQYLPKKESAKNITQADLNLIAARINDRPRKCLGYRTPYEVFYEELDGAIGYRM